MPLFRALAKNMAPMTNADESPDTFSYLPVSLCSIYSLTELNAIINLRGTSTKLNK